MGTATICFGSVIVSSEWRITRTAVTGISDLVVARPLVFGRAQLDDRLAIRETPIDYGKK